MARDDYKDLLGMVPDAEIAETAGVAESTVRGWRSQLGIAAFTPESEAAAPEGADVDDPDTSPAGAEAPDLAEGEAADEAVEAAPEADKPTKATPRRKAPRCVRGLKNARVKGPDGRTLRIDFRGIYRGDLAAFLWDKHQDLVERYPPKG